MESKIDVTKRLNQLASLETYLKDIDIEVTMILQSLQWDRKHLVEKSSLRPCQYDSNHQVPPDQLEKHEKQCCLKSQGYTHEDRLLPSPVDSHSKTLVKFNSEKIMEIIDNASKCQTLSKKGHGYNGNQPLTLDRLQATYTSDERRAIYDEVVRQVPSCHDLADLALLSSNDDDSKERKPKSKLEILAELRDMKRRRTKYRVAAKTRNYSDVLRDVINTQMELYTKAQNDATDRDKREKADSTNKSEHLNRSNDKNIFRHADIANSNRNKNTYKEQDSKINKNRHNESQHSKHHEEYERRKRRYESDDRYQSTKFSRPQADRHLTKHKSIKSNRRDERYTDCYFDRDRHTHYDKYGRRKGQPEKDTHYKQKTEDEMCMPASKDIKIEKCDSSDDIRKKSEEQCLERTTSNKRRERRNNDQNAKRQSSYEDVNISRNKKYVDNQKFVSPVRVKRKEKSDSNDNNDDHPHNSMRKETEHSETLKSYIKVSNDTLYDRHKPHCSIEKTDSEKETNKDYKSERHKHAYKLDLQSQGSVGVKKKINIKEAMSEISHDSDGKETERKYHEHKETPGYNSDSNRHKEKNICNDRSTKCSPYMQEELRECLKLEDVKRGQLDNSESSQDNESAMSNNYRHTRRPKGKYHSSDQNYTYNKSNTRDYERKYDRSHKNGKKSTDTKYQKKY